MSQFLEKTIASKLIYEGKIISLYLEDVQLPNGGQAKREVVKHPGAVAVIPITSANKLVLVRQFRKALEKEIYEIPAGKLDPNEAPSACAVRELKEETGYSASFMKELTSFYTSPGFADELIYLFEATGLEKGEAQPDPDEFVEVVEVTLAEAQELLEQKHIHDAKTAYAIQHWLIKNIKRSK
ncbi:NUDIX hydrolase [Bacillus horti]|uniref:ADP-ribose pyrophosphatase n=1 Tax=Caldalkalibacillus horti TaxID=77523 RepID=A0ABT9VUL1_9BACI|nr:NUDIX hydrolase [Bacillus horti]MDQ0164522.1 ADP-ribose pyrophosphatase [Bacillus horti]